MTKRPFLKIYHSAHFFPIVCAIIVLALTLLRISGTSVGLYNDAYYGSTSSGESGKRDPNLLANHPRSIRSDELLYNTPYIVGQLKNGSPYLNNHQGLSQNMSVIADAPYAEWTVIFRPQNLIFFVLPLEYAFAFKWWFLGFLLITSCYYFCLALLPGRRLWASLIAVSLFFAPFIQWWYQISTTACLFYSFFIALLCVYIMSPKTSNKHRLLLGGLLAYVLVCFGLILYPPFQIPCALVVAAFLIGYFLETRHLLPRKQLISVAMTTGAALLAAVALMLLFIKTRTSVIDAVTHTAYPGKRVILSGDFSVSHFFGSHLSPYLQSDGRAGKYGFNQSEAANFITLSPFLVVPTTYAAVRAYLSKQQLPWALICLNLLLLLFLSRLFVPHFNGLFHLLQLSSTPLVRMLAGIGLLGTLQLVLFLRWQQSAKRRQKTTRLPAWCVWLATALTFGFSFAAGMRLQSLFPGFIDNSVAIFGFSLLLAIIVWCIQQGGRNVTVGLSLLAAFSVVSTINVNPLYRGLQPLTNSALAQAMDKIGKADDIWATADTRLTVTQPFALGKRSLTGVYLYPQPDVWKPLGKDGPADTYNRFAHVTLKLDPTSSSSDSSLELGASDYFTVTTTICSSFLRQSRVKYIVTTQKLEPSGCAALIETVDYPVMDFYIYKLNDLPTT